MKMQYAWVCKACQAKVDAGKSACDVCACPADLSTEELSRWDKKEKNLKPVLPSSLSTLVLTPTIKCPKCDKSLYAGEHVCPHCYYSLSLMEIQQGHTYKKHVQRQGAIYAIILFPLFILFALLI